MHYVIVTKNEKALPSDQKLREAMTEANGEVHSVEPSDGGRKVTYNGDVAHSVFVNNLRKVADGKATSWHFSWGDMDSVPTGAASGERRAR